jgi:hypothetical protein
MLGFLLPLHEFDDILEFNLVASHWSCCYGVPPGITGWARVVLTRGQQGLENATQPLLVTGTFRLEEQEEAGYALSIYTREDAGARDLSW